MRLGSVLPLTHSSTWRGDTEGAYSSFGRTSALYARALVFCDTMQIVLRRKLSVLEASPTTLHMWVRQIRSSERVTPRYLECLTGVSVWLCSVYWCCILCLE